MNYPAASSGELTPQRSKIRTRWTTDFQRSIRKKEIAQKMLWEPKRSEADQRSGQKIGLEYKTLSEEEIEDLGLTILMKQSDRTKTVSRETVMRKLGGE
jgi:hypothetical protein